MDIIERLIRLSPVPVEFVDETTVSDFCGTYFKTGTYAGKTYIEIWDKLNDSEKIITLIHETGHAMCDAKNCECMKNSDHTEREIHANKFTLNQLIKHKLKKELKLEMKRIAEQARGLVCREYYIEAAQHIMELKLWQKCLDYIK